MSLKPDSLPEMRDIPLDEALIANVDRAIETLDRQLDMLRRNWYKPEGQRESVIDTSLSNVGVALLVSLWCSPLTLAEQWLLRQRLLRAEWDEVQFEPGRESFQNESITRVTLIEHKYKGTPPKICQTDAEYHAVLERHDIGRPG